MTKDMIEESVARAIMGALVGHMSLQRAKIVARAAIAAHTAALSADGYVIVEREDVIPPALSVARFNQVDAVKEKP